MSHSSGDSWSVWWRRLTRKHDNSSSSPSNTQKSSESSSTEIPLTPPSVSPKEQIVDVHQLRQSKSYDVCICHCEKDLEYALELECFLEKQSEALRCFLQLRDTELGGAIPTELCNALTNSHCWVLLITPDFLQDHWCMYQMQQALSEAPMSNGRIIPFIKDLDRSQSPRELKYMYKVVASSVREDGFQRIKASIMSYIHETCKSEIKD